MRASKLRAIIFDIGNVLVRVDVGRAMEGLAAGTTLSPREIWTALENDPRWTDWQEGRIQPAGWHRHLARRFGSKLSFEEFREVWNRGLSPEAVLPDAFLAGLSRNRYRLCVLSNTDPIHVAHMETNFTFLKHFPHRVYSCTARVRKPNALIYKEALRSCGAKAEQALYIDDVPEYAEAARRLGMDAIVFSSAHQLQVEMGARGITSGPLNAPGTAQGA